MPPTIPKRLKKEPAIEAVWQCFFDGQLPLPVAEMIGGDTLPRAAQKQPGMKSDPVSDSIHPCAPYGGPGLVPSLHP